MKTFDIPEDSKSRQCQVILQALRECPLSTIDARERLGVSHPAGRVMDLRKRGFNITTQKRWAKDSEGRPHKVGFYTLEVSHAG